MTRNMGGGPRTFPGGVNKWKWKRMHEKRARDKERRLLEQEKQLYEARIRSHIRSKLAPPQPPPPPPHPSPSSSSSAAAPTHGPMTPHDHIKALANRFMKEGAEDLWNNDDGPVTPPPPPHTRLGGTSSSTRPGSIGSPVDLRKLIPEGPNRNSGSSYVQSRDFSVSSKRVVPAGKRRFWRNDSDSDSEECESDECESDVKKIGNVGALGKYDVKRERRVMPKPYDEESDFEEKVELIKYELNKKKLSQHKSEEEQTILTQTRYSFQYDF